MTIFCKLKSILHCHKLYINSSIFLQVKMSKKRKIEFISPTKPALQVSNEPTKSNWSLCFICQKDTDEKLQSSVYITTGDPKQMYFEFKQRVMTFKSHDVMPIERDFPSLEMDVNWDSHCMITVQSITNHAN